MQTKEKQKTILLIIIVIFIFIALFLPSIKPYIYQSMNKEFIEKVDKYALSANIKIVQLKYRNQGNSSFSSVSAGASGVIIRREGNKYYALTAEHLDSGSPEEKTQLKTLLVEWFFTGSREIIP